MHATPLLFLIATVVALFTPSNNAPLRAAPVQVKRISAEDQVILDLYILQLFQEYFDVDSTTPRDELDRIAREDNMRIANADVTYSPDSLFKIFVVEFEGCGAYCNSSWYSWIHCDLGQGPRVMEAEFSTVESIHRLPDENYLVITSSHARPASVLTVQCMNVDLVLLREGSLVVSSSDEQEQLGFGFCQENGVEMSDGPYIEYNDKSQVLEYLFGNNYAYSHGLDIDTIYQGSFRYTSGGFQPAEEVITVNDRRGPEK